jgi:hypothetical protein
MFFNTTNLRLTAHNIQISRELHKRLSLLNDINAGFQVD